MSDLLKLAAGLALFFASTFALVQGSGAIPEEGVIALLGHLRLVDPLLLAAGVIGLLMLDLLVAIPTMTTILLAGWLLGPVWGGVVSSAGLLGLGIAGYGMGRHLGRPVLGRVLNDPQRLAGMDDAFRRQDLVVLFVCQALPILPEVSAVLAGVSRMRFARFVFGYGVGVVPFAFIVAAGGAASSPDDLRPAILTAIGTSTGLLVAWKLVTARRG